MLHFGYLKIAFKSIRRNKTRSFLTMLGVIIGVASVTALIALGQGLQNDVSSLIRGLGTNVLVVIGGKMDLSNTQSTQQVNPANMVSADILTLEDVKTLEETEGVELVSPITLVAGASLKYEDKDSTPMIMGAYPNIFETFQVLEIDRGEMFQSNDRDNVIVIGPGVKEFFFGEYGDAIGKKLTLNEEEFEIIATVATSKTTSLFASDFDYTAAIPYDTATNFNGGEDVFRIMVKARDDVDVMAIKESITEKIKENHGGEDNFTVFTQEDLLDMMGQFLGMATALVTAIAAISLVVGGIGIMNIMLVSVTERTKEIGLRKAMGATKLDILVQFLVEAIVVTLIGGLIGLGLAFVAGMIVATKTPLQADITPTIILIALGISVTIGVAFGIWPAASAARKDPIEAIRHE